MKWMKLISYMSWRWIVICNVSVISSKTQNDIAPMGQNDVLLYDWKLLCDTGNSSLPSHFDKSFFSLGTFHIESTSEYVHLQKLLTSYVSLPECKTNQVSNLTNQINLRTYVCICFTTTSLLWLFFYKIRNFSLLLF